MFFDKVKAAGIAGGIAGAGALIAWAGGYDWNDFGAFGPLIGAGVAVLAAYFRKETSGYGAGAAHPLEDAWDVMPTGAEDEE